MSQAIISLMTMTGLNTPFSRAMVFGIIGFFIENSLKMRISYTEAGTPRPWILLNREHSDATLLPPGWLSISLALFGGLFI